MQVRVKRKAQETWQSLCPPPTPPILQLFPPARCACQFVEGAHCIPLCCLSVCCCNLLYLASLPRPLMDFVYISVCTKIDNEDDVVLHLVTSQFSFGLASSPLAVFAPSPPFVQKNANQQSAHLECRSWGLISYGKKKHLHPPLNVAPDLEEKKNGKEKKKKETALSEPGGGRSR